MKLIDKAKIIISNHETASYAIFLAMALIVIVPLTDVRSGSGEESSVGHAGNSSVESDIDYRENFDLLAETGSAANISRRQNISSGDDAQNNDTQPGGEEGVIEESIEEGVLETKNDGDEEGAEDVFSYSVDFGTPNSLPVRVTDVLDPDIRSRAVLIHDLDDDIPLFYFNTVGRQGQHRLASVTKLLTAVFVAENLDPEEEIFISETAVSSTRTTAGNLMAGESYFAEDLNKLMLLSSSNVATVAFEEHFGGREIFIELMNEKAKELGMEESSFEDSSGISDYNIGTARDVLTLVYYMMENHPEIIRWTSEAEDVFGVLNSNRQNNIKNIIPLASWHPDFIGGKTGTTDLAGQNLVAVFNLGSGANKKQILFIVFDSHNRYEEVLRLVDWVGRAYNF